MGRKNAREGAMKVVYQMEIREEFSSEILDIYFKNNNYSESESEYISDFISKIFDKLDSIDEYISDNIHGWSIERLSKVDLSILRIAVYEMLYREDIPLEVSINEAIEIAKKYSSDESFKFINGVLGGVVTNIEEERQNE